MAMSSMNLGDIKTDAMARGQFRGATMSKNGIILIAFAWAMEIVGVSGGVINSTYTTFGEDLPNTFAGIAILGIFALGYLAVENWTFGFERIVDLRLKPVNTAKADALRAEDELSALIDQRKRMTTGDGEKRDELRRGTGQRDESIGGLTAQLSKEAEIHQKNLEEIREACRIIRDKCIVPRSQAEDARYTAEVGRLSAELARQRDERKRLQSQIDELVSKDASNVAELNQRIGIAERTVAEARKGLRNAIDKNQIYRLASSWYGVSTSDVTAEQFATARLAFSTFTAIAVALAGSIAALVYYARSRAPGAPSFLAASMVKLLRARRAYFARRRKPLKVEVPGPVRVEYRDGKEPPIVIEKPVDRFIDHIVLIPRWGIWIPTYINSLIRPLERSLGISKGDDPMDKTSNVMQLKRVN